MKHIRSSVMITCCVLMAFLALCIAGCDFDFNINLDLKDPAATPKPTNGLIAEWLFGGNAEDTSGKGNHGTVNGAVLTTDRFGRTNKAYSFDGVDDYISVVHDQSLNFSDATTISSWVVWDGLDENDAQIVSKETGYGQYGYQFRLINGNLSLVILNNDGFSENGILKLNEYLDESWHHVVGVYSDNQNVARIFLDGELVAENTSFNRIADNSGNTANLSIGNWVNQNGHFWKGKIDDIRIYNRALAADEIQMLYAEGGTIPPTPIPTPEPTPETLIRTIGGSSDDYFVAIECDSVGNLYVLGRYQNTVDFNAAGAPDIRTSNGSFDVFLSKYSSTGEYQWTYTFGSSEIDLYANERPNSIAFDSQNNVYIAASFAGTVDFDPGSGEDSRTSNGNTDGCLIKILANGSYGWTKTVGGFGVEQLMCVKIDNNNSIYAGGNLASNNIDFNPDSGSDIESCVGESPFIWKFNADGLYDWKKIFKINIGGYAGVNAFAFDANNNLFTLGGYEYTMDFDPGTGTDNRTSGGYTDIFLQKTNADGSYGGVRTIGSGAGTNNQVACDIEVRPNGNIYYLGHIQKYSGSGAVDMDMTSGIDIRYPQGDHDMFLAKMNNENSYAWTRQWSGSELNILCIVFAQDGSYYISGNFDGTLDFDPGSGIDMFSALGTRIPFVIKFNADDSYAWTKIINDSDMNSTMGCTANNNYLYLIGHFQGIVDLDPGANEYIRTSLGGQDIFIIRMLR